ncbi:hypothetical protein KAU11_08500 [Candidatus Babeliales bacterium]|nr:hypothetical protein [Candidatus Babeliales bacterium]
MNPYLNNQTHQAITASGTPIEDGGKEVPRAYGYTRTGAISESEDPMVNNQGEFNTGSFSKNGSTKDTMLTMAKLQRQITAGVLKSITPLHIKAERAAKFREAYKNKNSKVQMTLVGEVMNGDILEALGREAFARKTLQFMTIGDGKTIKHKIIRKDVGAIASNNDALIIPNLIKQDYIYPSEFMLLANILIDDKEIKQAGEDILEEKYNTGLEAIMTSEDRRLHQLFNIASGLFHNELVFSTLTPTVFSTMKTNIGQQGNIATSCLFAMDLWDDVLTDTEFSTWFDPVTKYNLILDGNIGNLMGVNLITDGYRHPNLKVLEPGEIFMLADPQSLGTICERQALKSIAIDRYNIGEPKRGWFMESIESMTVGNPLGVIHGQRV